MSMMRVATGCDAMTIPAGGLFEGHTMTTADTRRDFWLTLARAFLPPIDETLAVAVRDTLADDLDDLCREWGLDTGRDIQALRCSLAGLPSDADSLLRHYSRLFMAPPMLVRLNLCQYLDGSSSGASRDALDMLLARHGVEKADTFKDQPDHISTLLELMALLSSEHHEEETWLAEHFLRPALPQLASAINAAAPESPYHALVTLLQTATDALVGPIPDTSGSPANKRHDKNIGVWRHCDRCGRPYAREKELKIMAKALAEHGLPADHLTVCVDCRGLST